MLQNQYQCVICEEEYPSGNQGCPFCGFSAEMIHNPFWEKREYLKNRYMLKKVEDRDFSFPDGVYYDKERRENVTLRKIFEYCDIESFLAKLEQLKEKTAQMKRVCKVYDIYPPQGDMPGFYTCRYLKGSSLERLLERENPRSSDAEKISEELEQLRVELYDNELEHGALTTRNLIWDQNHIQIRDYGDGRWIQADHTQIQRLIHMIQPPDIRCEYAEDVASSQRKGFKSWFLGLINK